MLPNLSTLIGELQAIVNREISRRVHVRMGALGTVPKHFIHEGEELQTDRADGSSDKTELATSSAEIAIDARRTPNLTGEEKNAFIDALAEEMAEKISTKLYMQLDEILEGAGQTVQVKGQLGPRAVFDLIEKIELNFTPEGLAEPINTSFDAGMQEQFAQAWREIENTPALKQEMEDIFRRKKESFDDREAARKLVG